MRKYTLREQIKWHLQGFLIIAAGAIILAFIIGTIVLIAIPE